MSETVRINTHGGYDVHIGSKLLYDVGKLVKDAVGGASSALIVTDSNVAPLYLEKVVASLKNAGFDVCSFVFPAGESSKNFETLSDILEYAAKKHLTRRDCMVALGGGVTGDLTGFAAGCYMRGIE
ncbi:MAG TPA: iron-containing alcohol dehydrogenase, partial [Bacillota bacterium]|nr:iron-containing alcohol dehydrogenase [Bacillota bacterium]